MCVYLYIRMRSVRMQPCFCVQLLHTQYRACVHTDVGCNAFALPNAGNAPAHTTSLACSILSLALTTFARHVFHAYDYKSSLLAILVGAVGGSVVGVVGPL